MNLVKKWKNGLSYLNASTFISLSFFLLILSIPLQYRYHKVFRSLAKAISKPDLETPCFFEKIIFYCSSDIFILCLLTGLLFAGRIRWKSLFWEGPAKYLSAFFLVSLLSIIFSQTSDYLLQYIRWFQFFWVGLLFFFLSGDLLGQDRKQFLKKVFFLLLATALFQCVVATVQYFAQHYLGLRKLGEINITSPEVMPAFFDMSDGSLWIFDRFFHVVREKTTVIRAYGTLPHPNILGGFIVLSLFASYYLYGLSEKLWKTRLLGLAIFFQMFTLFITYSRSALFGGALGSVLWLGLLFWKEGRDSFRKAKSLTFILFGSLAICSALFYPQMLQRGGIINYNKLAKSADQERVMFQSIATNIVESHPLTGVGFNSFVLKMDEYSQTPLSHVHFHPVHNIFLLVAAETGIIGLICFILFLFTAVFKMTRNGFSLEVITLLCIFISFLFIGCCDFYFLDYQQGKLMFFVVIGLMGLLGKQEAAENIPLQTANNPS